MTLGAEAASGGTIARLTTAIEEFRDYHERLTDVRYGAAIARLHDNQLMHDYGAEVIRADELKRKIETVTGAWDRVREWSGLAALPLIPIAIALGLIAAISTAVLSIRSFMRRADIRLAIEQDPKLTYEQAANQVDSAAPQGAFGKALDVAQLGFFAVLAFVAFQLFKGR